MARYTGAVEFADGSRLYLIYCGTVNEAWRPLFHTAEEAWLWDREEAIEFPTPADAKASEESVTVFPDIYLEDANSQSFQSEASRKAMWLTGPNSRMKMIEEHRIAIQDGFTWDKPESLIE